MCQLIFKIHHLYRLKRFNRLPLLLNLITVMPVKNMQNDSSSESFNVPVQKAEVLRIVVALKRKPMQIFSLKNDPLFDVPRSARTP